MPLVCQAQQVTDLFVEAIGFLRSCFVQVVVH
jgi:hypothetical protein